MSAASLYYHFANKRDILRALAERELRRRGDGTAVEGRGHWKQWLPQEVCKLRNTLIDHPELIPVFANRQELGVGSYVLEVWIARMREAGATPGAIMPILDALRYWAIASAHYQSQGEGWTSQDPEHDKDYPLLERARADRAVSADQIFEPVVSAIIDIIEAKAPATDSAKSVAPRNGARSRGNAATRQPAASKKATARRPS